MADVAILAQDPRFGWGVRAQLDPFWQATLALGRDPELLYVAHPSLAERNADGYQDVGVTTPFGRIDALNQLVGARRLAPRVAASRSRWVVATTASHGLAAVQAKRRYGAWIGTSLEDEWRARRRWLPRSRRLALDANAPLLLRVQRRVLREASLLCATSPGSRDGIAAAAGVDPAGIRLLPIPIDIEQFTPTTDDEWLQHLERPTLAFVGRADDPRKNVALLLDALPLLRRRLPGVRVLLVGTPPRSPLPEGAEALGVVPSVADVVRTCALLVVTSRQEGFGVAAAEALACGVPVVSTPSGGPEELLERSGGGRVLAGFDPAELADTAADLLEQPARLLEMRAAGRRYVAAEHAPGQFAKRLEGLFEELDTDD